MKMELLVATHVVDAITFWAQNVSEDKEAEKIDAALSEICPTALRLSGRPSPHKFYGACYTGDRCWYRCKVQQQVDDKFHVTYVDYGNTEVVGRSDLVELPEDLQCAALAKKYRFWSFNLASELDSPHYTQGKSFLQNLISGKKLRISKKSICFDGTILVQAFQGNLDIGEEVSKFKFAKMSLPGNMENPLPVAALQRQTGPWTCGEGDSDISSPFGCLPKLRPVLSNQKPQIMKTQSTNTDTDESAAELIAENRQLNTDKVLTKAVSETCPGKDECVQVHMESTVGERFSRLAEKVEAVRRNRENSQSSAAEDLLSESITVVVNNRIVTPFTSDRLEVAKEDYTRALQKLRECQNKGELEDLVSTKNQICSVLCTAVDDFLSEVGGLPIAERLKTLKEVSSSLTTALGSSSGEDAGDRSYEQFCEWKNRKHQNLRNTRQATDKSLCALSEWAADAGKFFCLTEKSAVTLEAIAAVDELLKQAEFHVCEELNVKTSEQDNEETKIISDAFRKVMQCIEREQRLLCGVRDAYEVNVKFQKDVSQWQSATPNADELLCIKKRIKKLRSQLRWKLVEVNCLEEAEELDLPEVLRKKEEIAETRNALFQEIRREKEEYIKLGELVKGSFPELVQLHPEADIDTYLSSDGLLMKSLDRDTFDAEPMRELSGRRPLVCTEFQGQKVVLKSYSVDEESEVRMIEQAVQYHRAQDQNPSAAMPLLSLFFGKEVGKVMRGVLLGLQSLHRSCITHASLNPNNVFVLNRERGVIGDFDFTKTPEQRAVDGGMVAGSVVLVAPEIKRGQRPSPASDMFAFGGLLLWLHAPDCSGDVGNEPQAAEFTRLKLDEKLQTLIPKLLVSSGRPSALDVLHDDYFLALEN
ncbi:serine/threonine-protein kinase 31-like isoform X2 [Trichomycterus rosablanca]|uniref:serine/threonine-protein kinase 31-like isoform X2 n=1 Tax=Trichomycterus rosablanca TaxID=2290929 RepID=UPI002F35DB85